MLDPHKLARDCIADAPPPCHAACPLGVDVRVVIERAKIGSFSAAYKAFAKDAVFTGIVSHVCPRYCEEACVRSKTDEAIRLSELERYLWEESVKQDQKLFYVPDKKKSVMVAGGGIAGMTIASKLAQRGYHTVLCEKEAKLGGKLWELAETGVLPREVLEYDVLSLNRLKFLEIRLNYEVLEPESGYDAFVVCTGKSGNSFVAGDVEGVFIAGAACDPSMELLECIRYSCEMSYQIESYIKVGRIDGEAAPHKPDTSDAFAIDISNIEPVYSSLPCRPHTATAEDVKDEARRCLLCTCSNCVDSCQMLKYYKKGPKKTFIDLSDTLNKTPTVKKSALRQIMSCTQCGTCSQVCPVGVDFKSVCLESRRILNELGHLPSGLYDYWLRDMEFSNGSEAAVSIPCGDTENTSGYVLFPGCQMGASDPEYIKHSYKWMRDAFPGGAALLVGCCGAPAKWAGEDRLHQNVLNGIRSVWEELKRPVFVLPCPTCAEMFSLHLDDIPAVSLWELMAEKLPSIPVPARKRVSVFDPCSSKNSPETQDAVRAMLEAGGYELIELDNSRKTSACCGYGGLIYTSNPGLHGQICKNSAFKGELPYITYCVNCRDNFAAEGKEAIHILDALLIGGDRFSRKPPDVSMRRENRRNLRAELMMEYLNEETESTKEQITLDIPPELESEMNKRLIIRENIARLIVRAEDSRKRVLNKNTGHYTAHCVEGKLTFWAEYEPIGERRYRLHDAYSHRMVVEE